MPTCQCDQCGQEPESGQFLPGHDQKLRADLERRVGGLIPLKHLVASAESYATGNSSESDFTKTIRQLFTHQSAAKQ